MDIDIKDLEELIPPKKMTSPHGAAWLNWFMVRRREHRGDLIATMAGISFACLLITMVLGGSSLDVLNLKLVIPKTDPMIVLGLITPLVMHTIKGTVESAVNKDG